MQTQLIAAEFYHYFKASSNRKSQIY